MAQRRRTTEREIARGLRAVRSAGRTLARDVDRIFLSRGNARKPIEQRAERALRDRLIEITRSIFTGRDSPVKVAASESILAATGGNRKLARELLSKRNEFGRTLAQELQGARNRMLRRMKRVLSDGIKRGRSRREIANDIRMIAFRQTETKRVIAWHTARAANEAAFEMIEGNRFEIIPSPTHPKRDVCDKHFGIHRKGYPIPPYHVFCTCLIVPVVE